MSLLHGKKDSEEKSGRTRINYTIILSQTTLEKIILYKNDVSSLKLEAGTYLKNVLDPLIKAGVSLDQMSNETFLELLLCTKKPMIFAESEIQCDGSDWNRNELQLLGDISIAIPVEIYDNGIWSASDKNFQVHIPPIKGELLFTPGPLLEGGAMRGLSPDFEEISSEGVINQEDYNKLIDRRISPLLYYVNQKPKDEDVTAVITVPGIGCGAFAGKYRGQMGEHLNKALQHILEKKSSKFSAISCIYYDPFNECKNQERDINGVKYRVRPSASNPNKPQLLDPKNYQESSDDFSNSKLFKIVAWDHVSFPGNDYFGGSRFTDDGVAAAATNSMEAITGIRGKYNKGYYLPPDGKKDWLQVVLEHKINLKANNNVKIVMLNGACTDLKEFEKNQTIYEGIK